MKENTKESSYTQNDYPNGSSNKNNTATGSNKVTYQKLFSEKQFSTSTQKFVKKL